MTKAEMSRRLRTMTPEKMDHVMRLVRNGYNPRDIAKYRIGVTLAQANAVWQLMEKA